MDLCFLKKFNILLTFFINNDRTIKGSFGYPNAIERGDEQNINDCKWMNYTIKEDPTGTSPINIIEDFSPIKGSLWNSRSFQRKQS